MIAGSLAAILALAAGAHGGPVRAAPAADRAAPAAEVAPLPPVVAEVALELPPGEARAGLDPLVAVKPGSVLSRRALRRTVLALYATGRFGNVTAATRPAPGGAPGRVVLVLTLEPKLVVSRVEVEDPASPPALDAAAVRAAAALGPGDELWPGRVEDAVARVVAAYARRGHRAARVAATVEGDRQAAVTVTVDEGPATRVEALDVGGGEAAAPLAAELGTRPGGPLDLDRLDEDLKALRAGLRREGYLRARVGAPAIAVEGERARVQVPVELGPRVQFRFRGAVAFTPAELSSRLGLDGEQAIDLPALQAAAARVRAFYVAQGWPAARVVPREVPVGPDVAVVFDVDEGRRYRVREVRFPGVAQRGEPWVRDRLGEALADLAPAEPLPGADAERLVKASGSPAPVRSRAAAEPGDTWNPPVWDQAVARIVEHYRADGWLDAAHEGTRLAMDARSGTIDVEIALHEGVRTFVREVVFEGVEGLPLAEVAGQARLAPGDPLTLAGLDATRAAVLALYGRRGYVYARATDVEDVSPDRAAATVRFRVEEGPRVRLGNVVVSGARRTRQDVILDTLALQPGDVFDPQAAARSQADLLRLGVFRSVGLRLSDPDVPEPVKDLDVELSEGPYQTLAQGVGFSLANGPRAFVEFARPNVLGRALELTARAKVNYPIAALRADEASLEAKAPIDRIEGHVELGLHDPRLSLLGLGHGARVALMGDRLHRPSYDLSRGSSVFGLDVPIAAPLTMALQYELEVDHIQKSDAARTLTLADVTWLRYPEGITTLHSFRPVLVLDLRDNPLNPRRGLVATATFEYTHSIDSGALFGLLDASDNYQHFVKASAGVTGYLPLLHDWVVALSVRGGRIYPIGDDAKHPGTPQSIIPPKRFFLGGAGTMRGYGEDEMVPEDVRRPYLAQIGQCSSSISGLNCSPVARSLASGQTLISQGGSAFALAKLELRLPLYKSLEAGVFADVGNLWDDPSTLALGDVRVNLGAGLRFQTPIGPAVLDLGFNPSHDARLGEGAVAPHFSIGLF